MVIETVDAIWIGVCFFSFFLCVLIRKHWNFGAGEINEELIKILGKSATSTVVRHLETTGSLRNRKALDNRIETIFGPAAGSIISRRVYQRPSFQLFFIAILLLSCSIAQLLSTQFGSEPLGVALHRAKDLGMIGLLGLVVIVLSRYPNRVGLSSRVSRSLFVFLPFILSFLGLVLAPVQGGDADLQIVWKDPAILCVIGVGLYFIIGLYLFWAQAKRATKPRRAQVLIIGFCSILLLVSLLLIHAFSVFRMLPGVNDYLDSFSAISALSFVSVFPLTVGRYRFLDLSPIREARAPPQELGIASRLDDGTVYLFDNDDQALRAFSDLLAMGKPGLCVTRRYPEKIRKKLDLRQTPIVWLTREKSHPNALGSSNISLVGGVFMSFLEKGRGAALYCDGLEYLVMSNDFDKTLKCLYDVSDKISSSGSILILVVPPGCFDEKQIALLERDATRITTG